MAAEGSDSEDLNTNGLMEAPSALEAMEAVQLPTEKEEASEENGGGGASEAPEAAAATSYNMPLAENEEEEDGEFPADFDRLWKLAHDNPQDFSSWTDLLQYCEQESHMTASRRALVAFLARYPLCYGYWKKFADLERRAGYTNKAQEVCVQGLKAIPLSVDLWIHYINLLLGTLNMNLPESSQRIRSAFEEAVTAAGLDFHSDRLWELYIEWEKEQGDMKAATGVYDRVLRVPTQLYSSHYEKFKTHLNAHAPKDVLSAVEYEGLLEESKQSHKTEKSELAEGEEELPPGEEKEPTEEELIPKMRELLLARREKVYQDLEGEVRKRWNFEEAIKRPYFHVKPLDRTQLRAWHSYLDWELTELGGGGEKEVKTETEPEAMEGQEEEQKEEKEGSKSSEIVAGGDRRVRILFERCLIACALYEEFWTKYVQYLESQSLDEARGVFRRACEIHLAHKHTMHLQWATFEERHGDLTEARRVLEALETSVPGLAMVRLRRAGLERRAGRLDESEALLRDAVAQAKETPHLHAFYSIKLARLLLKLCKNPSKARGVLQEALEISPDDGKLHLNLLELEVSGDPRGSAEGVQQCVTRALAAPLSPQTKILFSQRGLQYAEDYGTSVQSVLTVYEEHQKLLKELGNKKRVAENGDSEDPEKMSKGEDGSAVPAPPQAPPTMPHVPMTTPPPPMMGGDMSTVHAGYGGYGSWHQQPQYGGYGGYQQAWNYNQGYYPPS
ncbi:pre-mRNA-processing factor 39-like isoform X1 [Oncorhynchus nerka]|uniref:pre-mRNA-processing factor 39-like isoform X1 n=1 Tax=Oncorhynchus nerka TaxID=8023 RepID=UPI00113015FF|nr:pre-mRNA-processing factor 39-like isoform X1 [Oncorhynchus nerka]